MKRAELPTEIAEVHDKVRLGKRELMVGVDEKRMYSVARITIRKDEEEETIEEGVEGSSYQLSGTGQGDMQYYAYIVSRAIPPGELLEELEVHLEMLLDIDKESCTWSEENIT